MKKVFAIAVIMFSSTIFAASAYAAKPRDRRKMVDEAKRCLECHTKESPGIVNDWKLSQHARSGITCLDCHKADRTDPDAQLHEKSYISVIVSPKDCSRCHPAEVKEFNESHHSKAAQFIRPSLTDDEKSDNYLAYVIEGKAAAVRGCEQCHGTKIEVLKNGVLDPKTWPNSGIGRVNPDGSKGSCTACHTRHKFSIAESRKPETCGTCHVGPDHPQIEIYMESKHGVIYQAEGHEWKWDVPGNQWDTQYYRAPTCATCHMSGIGSIDTTHNVSERLSWKLGSPLSVPRDNWKKNREKMQKVCLNCHSKNWVTGFYQQADNAVKLYNDKFYKPIKAEMDKLYAEGLLTKEKFDEELEYKFFEYWHHEGRRARMGAFMMSPDHTQWHGFYELARNKLEIENMIKELREKKHK